MICSPLMGQARPQNTSSVSPSDYVELDRRFRELGENIEPEQAALDSYTSVLLGHDTGVSWNDLLKRRLVVVLGEPGSGKTYEFRHRCEQVRSDGVRAFYVRLDALAAEHLRSTLDPDRWGEFLKWQQTNDPATFFLDSVDEAKFHKTADFYRALDRFCSALGTECLKRATILFSSRIREWQPHGDRSEVLSRFPQPSRSSDARESLGAQKDEPIIVVQIAPLDKERVGRYVRARGISNPQAFIDALDGQHLWEFTRRPADVVDLLDYWQGHGQFGSLTEMMEYSITSKLRPPQRDRGDPLSEQEGRDGAEILGAATALCRRFDFRVPDEAFSCPDAIDTNRCLPETWPLNKRQALLTRPLFDSASYGRIRFHTRRVAEYLAAAWLTKRMSEGCPINELEALLFDHVEDRRVMRQAMAPVIAWLCCGNRRWNEDLRSWVLESNPVIHLLYGDPSGLPLEYRRRILNVLVQMSAGRTWLRIDSSPESLGRLATTDLSDDLCQIIGNGKVAVSVREELIQMVRFGRLQNCLKTLLDLIESPKEPEVLKRYAAAAIRDVGDEPSRHRLREIVRGWNEISHGLCATVCEALYPRVLDAHGLIALIQKVGSIPPRDNFLSFSLRSRLDSAIRREDAEEILAGLLRLQGMPGFSWSLEAVPTVLLVLLQKSNPVPSEIETAAQALAVIADEVDDGVLRDDKLAFLDEATARHPSVRQRYLWHSVEQWRQQNKDEPISWMAFPAYFQILHPSIADLVWLLDDMVHRENPEDRVLALRLVMETWHQSGRKWRDRQKICRAAGRDARLLPVFRRLAAGGRWLYAESLWHHFRRKLGRKWWWNRRLQRAKERWIWLRGQWTLFRNIRALRSGRRWNWLASLLLEASGAAQSDKWGVQSWDTLCKKRGQQIANATREGCKRFWKTFVPQLPHERADRLKIPNRVIVGLTGIQAALDDGDLDLSTITPSDAELAARYAMNDLAGFSPWLSELVRHNAEPVRKVLCDAISGEWQASVDRKSHSGVIEDAASYRDGIIPLVEDRILELLKASDPASCSVLSTALFILLRSENAVPDEVATIAQERIPTLSPDSQALPLWISVWLQLDAGPAIDFLEGILPKTERGDQIMVEICALLGGERLKPTPCSSNPRYMAAEHCQRFIPLVYRHVKRSQDIDRSGGDAYAPESRDFAQRFRDGLLERLSKSEDDHVAEALRMLLTTRETAHLRDWILYLLDQRLQKEADLPPWKPEDIRVFMRDHEIDPKTDADLFRIVCERLEGIKHDVERSDNSLREEVRSDDAEAVLRRWLARKLRDRSRGRYTVPQEEEIDQQKRPDLRIENPHTAPVSIEIKWAGNWTVPELLERLENQLCGQYLRSDDCRHGVYLLGMIGQKRHWEYPTPKTRLSFAQVLDLIRRRAEELVTKSNHVQAVEIVSVDFRPPGGH